LKKLLTILFFTGITSLGFSQTHEDPILVDVDIKPTWKGCENEMEAKIRENCLENNLAAFFNDFIIYPERAKKKKLEGQVIVQFVVEKDGSITNVQVIHDIGEGCGEEVVRAMQHLPKLVPGTDEGLPVRVLYKAPFNFVLK
jgi:TonB family protein